jgi:lysophospholipase L1-like esterase
MGAIGLAQGARRRSSSSLGTAVPNRAIVAWGDSLTLGAGATAGHAYPTIAADLFTPSRTIANRGIGGQHTATIAGRQGGMPVRVTLVDGNLASFGVPSQSWSWNFDDGLATGWSKRSGDGTMNAAGGALALSGLTSWLNGPMVALGTTVPDGYRLDVSLDVPAKATGAIDLRVGFLTATGVAGAFATATAGYVSAIGSHSFSFTAGNGSNHAAAFGILLRTAPTEAVSFTVDSISIHAYPPSLPASVLAQSPNILTSTSGFSGTASGMLNGIHGTMTTDGSGNWSFARDAIGPAVACPPDSRFVPDDATAMRRRVTWIWAGNVGIDADGNGVDAALAALSSMTGYLGHGRYLVAGALSASSDSAGKIAARTAFNAALSTAYGARYVDLPGALRTANDGSANDLLDIAAGYVPRSLRVDELHLNDAGYAIVAAAMHAATVSRGW